MSSTDPVQQNSSRKQQKLTTYTVSYSNPTNTNYDHGVLSDVNENRGSHNRHHLPASHHYFLRNPSSGTTQPGVVGRGAAPRQAGADTDTSLTTAREDWIPQCLSTPRPYWPILSDRTSGSEGAEKVYGGLIVDMGVGSSKYPKHKHRHAGASNNHERTADKSHYRVNSKVPGHKILVQPTVLVGPGANENHHNAQSDSVRIPVGTDQVQPKPGCVDFHKFRVVKLKAAIDKKPTSVDEKSSAVLKYKTPHFRALATVEVPILDDHHTVNVGWIQTCTEMKFVNTYGDEGLTSWEFPEIVSGKFQMIGDADGKQYPWYGSKNELASVSGPTREVTPVSVHMNDNFFPQVTWYVPDSEYDKTPRLTHIHRKQRFFTYLVAHDLQAQRYHILQVVEWSMELNIDVNPMAPLGKRARLIGPMDQIQPREVSCSFLPLQPYALKPPNANNAQTLVWRPRRGEPRIIVPPIETTMDMEKYIISTRNLDMSPPSSSSKS